MRILFSRKASQFSKVYESCRLYAFISTKSEACKSETIHIYLQEHELSLYLALSEGNRKILRRAQKESYQVILYKEPSIENLKAFQQFYNQFAKRKN